MTWKPKLPKKLINLEVKLTSAKINVILLLNWNNFEKFLKKLITILTWKSNYGFKVWTNFPWMINFLENLCSLDISSNLISKTSHTYMNWKSLSCKMRLMRMRKRKKSFSLILISCDIISEYNPPLNFGIRVRIKEGWKKIE